MQIWYELNKKKILLFGFVVLIVFSVIWMVLGKNSDEKHVNEIAETEEIYLASSEKEIGGEGNENWYVDIKGAVLYPGMYPAKDGMRVYDMIELAGGLTKEADRNQINLAERISDQMVIYIPKEGEELTDISIAQQGNKELNASRQLSDSDMKRVNINTADLQELTQLSGIGEKKAQAIIDFRDENGSFQALEDLKKVKGIGEKTFETLKESITIN